MLRMWRTMSYVSMEQESCPAMYFGWSGHLRLADAVIAHPKGHANLPPSFFQLCGMDPMRDDGLIYAGMLEDVGVATKVVMYPGLPHDFALLLPQLKSVLQFRKDQVKGFGWLLGREPMLEKVTMFT